jgi:hypothetical protein
MLKVPKLMWTLPYLCYKSFSTNSVTVKKIIQNANLVKMNNQEQWARVSKRKQLGTSVWNYIHTYQRQQWCPFRYNLKIVP